MLLARLAALVAALALALPLSAAQQVEVHLRSGAVITGEVVSEDADKLVLKSTAVGKSGKAMTVTIPYKRGDIAKVVELGDPEEQYRTRKVAAATAAEHLALAQWCRANQLEPQAIEQAKLAVEQDPALEAAVKMVGEADLALVDGQWVKESEALAAQGKVRHQGKVMTVAEADALKASAKQEAADANAERAAEDKAGALASLERQLVDLKKRPPQLDAELQKANADLAAAQGLGQKVASAKSSLDAAQQSLDQARSANQNNAARGAAGGAPTNLQPLMLAVESAQKALAAARREAAGAEGQVAQAKSRITTLGTERKNLDKKLEALTARRDAAARAAEQAKAAKPAEAPKTAP